MSTESRSKPLWWRHESHGLAQWWIAGGTLEHTPFELPHGSGKSPNILLLGAAFQDVDFSGLEFDGFTVADSLLVDCNFTRTAFDRVNFGVMQFHSDWNRPIDWSKPLDVKAPRYQETRYVRCQFRETKLPRLNTHFGKSRFQDCMFDDTLRSTIVYPIFTQPAEFVDCRFTRRVSCVVFDGLVKHRELGTRLGRSKSEFSGNDFSKAVLKSVDFRDIDLKAQRLPPGFSTE